MDTRLLTVPQAAERLGYSTDTVYRLIRGGRLRAVRNVPGSPWRITETDLASFIDGMVDNQAEGVAS